MNCKIYVSLGGLLAATTLAPQEVVIHTADGINLIYILIN